MTKPLPEARTCPECQGHPTDRRYCAVCKGAGTIMSDAEREAAGQLSLVKEAKPS